MCVGLYEEFEHGRRVKRSFVQPSLVLTLSPSQINMVQCYKKHLDLAGIDREDVNGKLFCPAASTRVYCTTRFNLVHVFTVQQNFSIEEDTPSINGVQNC